MDTKLSIPTNKFIQSEPLEPVFDIALELGKKIQTVPTFLSILTKERLNVSKMENTKSRH